MIAVSALLLASLYSAATPVNAADTKPLVPETCESGTRVYYRSTGHPGKSALFPQRNSVQCSRPVRKSLTLAAYEDVPGGRALVAGKTERAIELIYAKQAKPVSAQTLINLCVAHTVLRQFEEASETCDAAVASANAMRADTRYRAGTSRKSLDEGRPWPTRTARYCTCCLATQWQRRMTSPTRAPSRRKRFS